MLCTFWARIRHWVEVERRCVGAFSSLWGVEGGESSEQWEESWDGRYSLLLWNWGNNEWHHRMVERIRWVNIQECLEQCLAQARLHCSLKLKPEGCKQLPRFAPCLLFPGRSGSMVLQNSILHQKSERGDQEIMVVTTLLWQNASVSAYASAALSGYTGREEDPFLVKGELQSPEC